MGLDASVRSEKPTNKYMIRLRNNSVEEGRYSVEGRAFIDPQTGSTAAAQSKRSATSNGQPSRSASSFSIHTSCWRSRRVNVALRAAGGNVSIRLGRRLRTSE